jgi:hypothetical protein
MQKAGQCERHTSFLVVQWLAPSAPPPLSALSPLALRARARKSINTAANDIYNRRADMRYILGKISRSASYTAELMTYTTASRVKQRDSPTGDDPGLGR